MENYIEHVAITVSDMEKSLDFYIKILGFSIKRGPSPHTDGLRIVAFLEKDGIGLEMYAIKEGKLNPQLVNGLMRAGINHVAFTVNDIDAFYYDLIEKGVVFSTKPREASGGRKVAFFSDPDGILLQPVQTSSH